MKRNILVLSALIGASVILPSSWSSAAVELATFAVSNYQGVCGGSNLPASLGMETAFQQEVGLYTGSYEFDVIKRNHNLSVDSRDFIDEAQGGSDHASDSGTDWADVVYFSGHGAFMTGSSCRTALVMGDDNPGICKVEISDQIVLGDRDANLAIFFASVSLQKCGWDNGYYNSLDGGGSGKQLAVVTGFHGSPYGGNDLIALMGDYAYYAKANGVGDDWIDVFFELDYNGSNGGDDDCPVVVVFSEDSTKAQNAFFNGGIADWKDTGPHTGSSYFYVAGCDPFAGPAL